MEEDDLMVYPLLFQTVRNNKQYVLWQFRKSVFKLKLYDVINFQKSTWKKHISNFTLECPDIIPQFPLDPSILRQFNLTDEIQPRLLDAFASREDYETYLRKIEESEFEQLSAPEKVIDRSEDPTPTPILKANVSLSKENPSQEGTITVNAPTVTATIEESKTFTKTMTAMEDCTSQRTSSKHQTSSQNPHSSASLGKRIPQYSFDVENNFWKYIELRMMEKDIRESLKNVIKSILLSDNSSIDPLRVIAEKWKEEKDEVLSISSSDRSKNFARNKSYEWGKLIEEAVRDLDLKRLKVN